MTIDKPKTRQEPPLSASRPMKSSEWVQADLLQKMENGEYAPGDKLPSVVELGLQYGVGRSTIREAMSALKAMGRVSIRQGGGTFVLVPQEPQHPAQFHAEQWTGRAAEIKRIQEVRRVLETGCASLAASNRLEGDLAAMADLLEEMGQRLDDQAFSEQADVRFHLAIAAATHNPLLVDMMQSLKEQLHDHMKDTRALWFYAEKSSSKRLLREHRLIYEAIARGDAQEAYRRMESHISKVEQVLNKNTVSKEDRQR